MSGLWGALTRNGARTDPASPDPALRGRTYAIPFDRVWSAALELAGGNLRGWRLVEADDQGGLIVAEATRRLLRGVADVRVRVGLDADGQTRVDADSASRGGGPDLGADRRRIRRFMAALDARLGATPGQILEPGSPRVPR